METKDAPNVFIQRPVYTVQKFQKDFDVEPPKKEPLRSRVKSYLKKKCLCTKACATDYVLTYLPFLRIFMGYNLKKDLLHDIIAGVSIGVVHIPQGMGFALLAQLPPVYGLYTSTIPVWVYFFFGTSRHISIGTMALTSLMVGAVVQKESEGVCGHFRTLETNSTSTDNVTDTVNPYEECQAGIATTITLMAGIVQLVMWFCHLDISSTYMSMPFVSSFMTGASIHIFVSQLSAVLGVSFTRPTGVFSAINTLIELFSNIASANVAAVVTSIICLIFLLFIKEFINVKYKKKLKIPIPAELLLIIIATLVSEYAKLNDKYDIAVIGSIPNGFPTPKVPSFTDASNYIGDSILIAIVSFAISITMAKLLSAKHGYEIDSHQEMLAYGLHNTISAFFGCFTSSQAPPRTMVNDSTGGRTQIACLVGSILPLIVYLALGPLFRSLPNAVLGSIIIAALFPLFKEFKNLKLYWQLNIFDLVVWVVTLLSVVLLTIDIGLGIGVFTSIFMVVVQSQLVRGRLMVAPSSVDVYVPCKWKYTIGNKLFPKNVLIFAMDSSLYFANVETFKTDIISETNKAIEEHDEIILEKSLKPSNSNSVVDWVDTQYKITTVVFDCSAISYIDIMGLNALKYLRKHFSSNGIKLVLATCKVDMINKLYLADVVDKAESGTGEDKLAVYPTVHDAVMANSMDEVAITVF